MLFRLCEGSCELVPAELKRLKIDRVDLVPEGANSAAFVTLYKGKELNHMELDEILEKMKPEHAEVIKSTLSALKSDREAAIKAKEDAEAARDEAIKAKEDAMNNSNSGGDDPSNEGDEPGKKPKAKTCTKKEGTTSFDEDEQLAKSLEGVDPVIKEYIERINKQKDAAEEVAKTAIAKEKHAAAVAKAEDLKALPVEKGALVDFIEKSSEETVDMLSAIAKGIEGTVLTEVGKSAPGSALDDAWSKIENKADEIAKERNITKEAAVSVVIEEQPDLYKEYLEGGAN